MNVRSVDSAIRVGVVGLGRRGRFLLERWLQTGSVQVTAACDVNAAACTLASPLCGQVVDDLGSLLAGPPMDAVCLAVPIAARADLAQRILAAGKHVLFADPPIAADSAQAAQLYETADRCGGRLAVWSPWQADLDFRTAAATIRAGHPGRLRFVRYERWNAAAPDAAGIITGPADSSRGLIYILDQLITLVDAEPARITAHPFGDGLTVIVDFAAGPMASITLHPHAAMNLDSGWAFDGEHGGYAAGRRWVRTDDGEVYDLPIEPPAPTTPEDLLHSLVVGESLESRRNESLRLINVLNAVARSRQSGQTVELPL